MDTSQTSGGITKVSGTAVSASPSVVATFITFRTADSMPREVVEKWKGEIKAWLACLGIVLEANETLPNVEQLEMLIAERRIRKPGKPGSDSAGQNTTVSNRGTAKASTRGFRRGAAGHIERHAEATGYSETEIVREYINLRNRLWQFHLDACHGACLLQRRELAILVLDSLRYFDGERYNLDSAIIMPNHVHLIAQFRLPTTCREQCQSWLHFTAFQINQLLGTTGKFWQSEPFDHLIRSEEQFLYLRRYIADNGQAAQLKDSQYLYWSRE